EPHGDLAGRRMIGWALKATGEREQARLHAAAALADAESLRERWWLASAAWDSGLLSLYEGDWHGARELADRGLAAPPGDPRHLALGAALEYAIGDVDAGAGYISQLQQLAENVPPPGPIADHVLLAATIPLVGRTANSARGFDTATAAAERVL